MDHLQKHLRAAAAALLLSVVGGAHAFVTPSPPPGFGGTAGAWTYTPPTASGQLGSIMRGPGPTIAGAGERQAAYKLGSGAARALAGRAAAGLIPGVGLALGLAWLASYCYEKQGGQWVMTCGNPNQYPVSDGLEYRALASNGNTGGFRPTKAQACIALRDWYTSLGQAGRTYTIGSDSPSCVILLNGSPYEDAAYNSQPAASCPTGWYVTPAGCVQTPPPQTVTQQELEDDMATKPLPQTLPPGVPYPLDPTLPSIWNPTETNPPTTQPLRIPQGNPVPIPNSDPAAWRQPVTRWTHSPTQAEPWRMDVQPEDLTSTSPDGLTSPESVTPTSPEGTPKEEKNDLCALHPEILACADLDTPTAEDLETEDRGGPITPDSGWGSENASCPAPRVLTVQGRQIPIPYTLFCTYMEGIRPLVIAMAWLSAGFILLGRKGGD